MRLMMGDCLERMKEIEDGSVDLVLTDPPYGTTACKWDAVIPFEQMWAQVWRVLKTNGAAVFTASQPFTSALVMSQADNFKYEWAWIKNIPTNFANARRMPMTAHENICVFYRCQPTYNKQETKSNIEDRKLGGSNGIRGSDKEGAYGRLRTLNIEQKLTENVSPRTTLDIKCVPRARGTLHPTQKPVALMEYLIRTYTNESQTVLDFTMGSGTTGVSCVNTNRNFIGIERDPAYFQIAKERIEEANRRLI